MCFEAWARILCYFTMCLKTAGWGKDSRDPDQMPHFVASYLGLHSLLSLVLSNTCGYYASLTLKLPITTIVICFVICLWFLKKSFLQTVWTEIRLLLKEQSDQGPRCLPVCKNRFEKFARLFSRRHKQTTFSDAGFLGILRVKKVKDVNCKENYPKLCTCHPSHRTVNKLPV